MLFDLHNDPEEKIDISNTHPEVLKDMLEALQLKMVIQQKNETQAQNLGVDCLVSINMYH